MLDVVDMYFVGAGTAWNNTYHSKKWIYVSSGASVGSLLIFTAIALLLFYTIMSRRKRESHQANQYTTKESSPTYDTIISDAEQYTTKESSPIYETIISDADTMDLKVEFVKTTSNEAYRKI